MNITINILEVVSELADKDLTLSYGDEGGKNRFPNGIITDFEDGTCYTEEAQDFFNERYDYWWDFLYEQKIGVEDE